MAQEKKEQKISFETAMGRLEEIVKLLERGEAPLEKSLELFEEGTRLMKICGKILDEAEQKVLALTKAGEDGPVTAPFEAGG